MLWTNLHPSRSTFWYLLAALLLLPALLINLGMMTLNDDEAIRTLVAMEMNFSDNYIVPTLNGALYRSKPPLFNWILHLSFSSFGVNEWSARLPNIIFLLGFGFLIFWYSKKYLSKEYSVLNALLFITCGRILFWDSMLAYIDILYSGLTFWSFMLIFYQFKRQQWWSLFIWSYALAGLGFLLKGFPSLLFQGLTLGVYFIYRRSFKRLISVPHVVGIIVFGLIVGSYYFAYNMQADLGPTINGLLDQSTRRTSMHAQYDYKQFFLHLLTYPFENIYHFLPWTLMVVYLFAKRSYKAIREVDFLKFCILTFGINILVYWASVEVYPRYILMLVPLVFSVLLYLHKVHYDAETVWYKSLYIALLVLFGILILGGPLIVYKTLHVDVAYRYLKIAVSTVALIAMLIAFVRYKHIRLICFVCVCLVMRIVFNWFFIPERHQGDQGAICKAQAIELGKKYKDLPINIYRYSNIDLTSSVYIARERGRITPKMDFVQTEGITILDTARFDMPQDVEIEGTICVREGQQTLFLIRKKSE